MVIKINEKTPLCRVKSLNYLNNILARIEAQREGADDALLLNSKNEVAESAVSNVFMVKRKDLITPSIDSGILPGITREIVLSLADELGMRPLQRRVKLEELKKAKEVFLTNTLMEVIPVVKIDKKIINRGKPGPTTKSIHRLYFSRIRRLAINVP